MNRINGVGTRAAVIWLLLFSHKNGCLPPPAPGYTKLDAVIVAFGGVQVLSEGLRATHHRMVKHVTREGQLLGPLWAKLSDTLFAMFSRYVSMYSNNYIIPSSYVLLCTTKSTILKKYGEGVNRKIYKWPEEPLNT